MSMESHYYVIAGYDLTGCETDKFKDLKWTEEGDDYINNQCKGEIQFFDDPMCGSYLYFGYVVIEGRVTKLVHKMVDEGIIPENWDEHYMGTIDKNIGKEVYYDCVKQEPETVEHVGELFGKLASGTAMKIVRGMLAVQTINSRF